MALASRTPRNLTDPPGIVSPMRTLELRLEFASPEDRSAVVDALNVLCLPTGSATADDDTATSATFAIKAQEEDSAHATASIRVVRACEDADVDPATVSTFLKRWRPES